MDFSVDVKFPNTALFNGRAPQIVEEESRRGLNAGVLILESAIKPAWPVGVTGASRAGVQTSVTGTGVNMTGRVFNPVSYAMAVETGRKPGTAPPADRLLLWVRRKLKVSEADAKGVAYVVARAIGRRGTKGAFPFRNAFVQKRNQVEATLNAIPTRIVQRLGQA
jgi:hypothetical protein